MRASQINGCSYCLDMHSKDARANGETEQRLYGLDAWRDTPYYSARERAALEWTEALTLVSETHVPDEVYERVREQFSEDELTHLSLAVVAINGWNRLNIAARTVPATMWQAASQRCKRRSDRCVSPVRTAAKNSGRPGFGPVLNVSHTRRSSPASMRAASIARVRTALTYS